MGDIVFLSSSLKLISSRVSAEQRATGMFTRPKLMLPFQIARAILSSPSKRPSPNRPPEEGRNARCMPRGNRYGYDSFPPAPLRSPPASFISIFYRSRHQRGALAAAPSLLLAGRSRVRPAAGDRDGGLPADQPHPQGAVQHPAAVPDRPVGEHALGRADGDGARFPERALPERG